jgi:hypothetical protein
VSLQTDLDDLQTRLMDRLRILPGATDLYLFGSRATDAGDAYSDVDLEVFTADVIAAQEVWPRFLECVAPIGVAFPLIGALAGMTADAAYTVLFHNESSYHTVDIGLRRTAERAEFTASIPSAIRLWSQESADVRLLPPASAAYIPAPGSAGHLIFDELISGVRYVKARKRSQPLTCWRYMRNRPQRWLQLVSDELRGWPKPSPGLTTWDIKLLDARLRTAQHDEFERHLDWSDSRKMDGSFYWFTQETVALALRRAETQHEDVPLDLVARLLAFAPEELELETFPSLVIS